MLLLFNLKCYNTPQENKMCLFGTSLKYSVNYSALSFFMLHHMRSLCKIVLTVSNGLPLCKVSQQEKGGNRAKIATRVLSTGEEEEDRKRERGERERTNIARTRRDYLLP